MVRLKHLSERGDFMTEAPSPVQKDRFDAVLFDLDGVLTATASIHAACWKQMFDAFLQRRAADSRQSYEPFDIGTDYRQYVDGRLRYDGVRAFLESRGIHLPEGTPEDSPQEETIRGLGNRKDAMVKDLIATGHVGVYEGSVAWVRYLREQGFRTAVVSASKNCPEILKVAGISDLFDVKVDGNVAEKERLPGKPAPDTFLHAARLLGIPPQRAVVVEDAISGVQAGKAGNFGMVIGMASHVDAAELKESGADLVVAELGELLPKAGGRRAEDRRRKKEGG
jgi:beta-phosphoglucomutase family hydrolase